MDWIAEVTGVHEQSSSASTQIHQVSQLFQSPDTLSQKPKESRPS
jgi:hypothetical protein